MREILNKPIESLDLSARSWNCLKSVGVDKVSELCKYSEDALLSIPFFGRKSLTEIKEVLSEYNLSLEAFITPEDVDQKLTGDFHDRLTLEKFFIDSAYYAHRGKYKKAQLRLMLKKCERVRIKRVFPNPSKNERNLNLFLHNFMGHTYRELGEMYNISKESVRVSLCKTFRQLAWRLRMAKHKKGWKRVVKDLQWLASFIPEDSKGKD